LGNSAYSQEAHLKRGAAYLKLGEAEKAVADFDYLIEERFYKDCPQSFLLRTEAYKLAGKLDLAEADEKRAAELPKNRQNPWCQINLLN
jgi:tetratricopeptide (TPR) repeat protein